MPPAPPAALGFSPLDDELGLLPGSLTPQAQAALVRLGAEREFAPAATLLAALTGIQVSEPTARRHTYAGGALLLAQQTAAAPPLAPPADPGLARPSRLQVSVDGAMIPLVGGRWAEVKTLVVGEVVPILQADGTTRPQATQLSYFSRLAPAATFIPLSVVETHRRGLRAAAEVAAVLDGAEWLQGWTNYHCSDATRILDQPHALEHLYALAEALWGSGPVAKEWWAAQGAVLREQGPDPVLSAAVALAEQAVNAEEYARQLHYLQTRREQMAYPQFVAAGWPVGSGIVESANKLVVERRLKGAGMRWAEEHVNPLLALRNALCSARWSEAVAVVGAGRRAAAGAARQARRAARGAGAPGEAGAGALSTASAPAGSLIDVTVVAQVTEILSQGGPTEVGSAQAFPSGDRRRPAANHPWRRSPLGKACAEPLRPFPYAKL